MNTRQLVLARKQLDRRLSAARDNVPSPPRNGWIKSIREALGMSARQLARRIGAVPSRVSAIESAETTGGITIKSLRQVAEGLNCTFVYAFVPNEPLDEIVRQRAVEKANALIARLDHTMRLENQALDPNDLKDERDRLVAEFLTGSPRELWNEE